MNYLEALEYNPWKDEKSKETIKKMIFEINERLYEIEEMIRKLTKKREGIKKKIEAIERIKGIGFLTAVNLFLFFEKKGIRNRQEATALVGLDPIVYESGKRKICSRISKQGDSYLKSLLYMAAMCAIRTNEKIQDFFTRLVRAGKPKKVALVACMRKLLIIALAHYKKFSKNLEVIS